MPPLRSIRNAILLVALWTAQALWRHKIFYGALGIVLFGTAAAFGAVRFGFGLDNENLITMHRFAGQFGGLIGLILFTCQLMIGANTGHKWHLWHAGLLAQRYCWPFLAINPRNAVSHLVIRVCSSVRHAHPQIALRGPVKAALAGVMLVNVLVCARLLANSGGELARIPLCRRLLAVGCLYLVGCPARTGLRLKHQICKFAPVIARIAVKRRIPNARRR